MYNDRTDLEQRTTDFMHALAASNADAVNISADRNGTGMMVFVWLHDSGLEHAKEIAGDHGFTLYGEDSTRETAERHDGTHWPYDQGRKRYRFETEDRE